MAFLIDSLIGNPVVRQDEKRLSIPKRPLPVRPRDFFELFAAMGANASPEGLVRGMDLKMADPRGIMFAVLERWPTSEELAAIEVPYRAPHHIRLLLRTPEFRTPIVRRLFEAFPERIRLLQVRMPRCAGEHALAMLAEKHPVLPLDLGTRPFREAAVLVPLLGALLSRFATSRTLVVVQPHIAAFLEPPAHRVTGDDPLHWDLAQPPCRAIDRLFAVIRPPEDILLSQANALLTALRAAASDDEPAAVTAEREHYGKLPAPDQAAQWKALGKRVLARVETRNPLCSALGDGTAEGALAVCARSPLELVGLHGYAEWARGAFDSAPPDPVNVSARILLREDLGPEDLAHLEALTSEDRVLYDRYARKSAAVGLANVKACEI